MSNCFIELSNESENVLVLSTDREAGGDKTMDIRTRIG